MDEMKDDMGGAGDRARHDDRCSATVTADRDSRRARYGGKTVPGGNAFRMGDVIRAASGQKSSTTTIPTPKDDSF
jgi:leucyl aminopeptidase